MRSLASLMKKYMNRRVSVMPAKRDGLKSEVYCIVRDASIGHRQCGRERLLVEPLAGEGLSWVSPERCRILEETYVTTPPNEPGGAVQHDPLRSAVKNPAAR